jgi:hypothetical protein
MQQWYENTNHGILMKHFGEAFSSDIKDIYHKNDVLYTSMK